jgi:hypothetical protein
VTSANIASPEWHLKTDKQQGEKAVIKVPKSKKKAYRKLLKKKGQDLMVKIK